jgi:transposase, IS5 family
MGLGSLIIKEKLKTSDRETVEQIRENPYLQYFLGLSDYSNEAPFEPSMMVYFRERIGMNLVNTINKKMVQNFTEKNQEKLEKKTENRKLKKPKIKES